MSSDSHRYVVRFGPTGNLLRGLALSVAALAIFAGVPMGVGDRILGLVIFIPMTMLFVVVGLIARPVAMIVDSDGLTLRGSLLRRRARPYRFGWSDVLAIDLTERRTSWWIPRQSSLNVALRPGSVQLSPGEMKLALRTSPDMTPEKLVGTRLIGAWKLDWCRFVATLAVVATHVPVRDLTGRYVTRRPVAPSL